MRKKPRFTHGRDNLGGDVSRKRFNTHVMERNVDRIVEGQCGNDKGMESASGEDDKRVERGWKVCQGQMCDCAGWQLWGWEKGKTRVRARDAPTRGSVTWVRSGDTATEYCHRPPITG